MLTVGALTNVEKFLGSNVHDNDPVELASQLNKIEGVRANVAVPLAKTYEATDKFGGSPAAQVETARVYCDPVVVVNSNLVVSSNGLIGKGEFEKSLLAKHPKANQIIFRPYDPTPAVKHEFVDGNKQQENALKLAVLMGKLGFRPSLETQTEVVGRAQVISREYGGPAGEQVKTKVNRVKLTVDFQNPTNSAAVQNLSKMMPALRCKL